MPSYLTPGVYIQENLLPLPSPPILPGAVTAAFVGTSSQGPAVPTAITSWSQYSSLYGGFGDGTHLLPYAVYQYFLNGGVRAYIARAVASDAAFATVQLNDQQGTPAPILSITAASPGISGNNVYVSVSNQPIAGRFNLLVYSGGTSATQIVDRYLDVTLDPADPRYLMALINSPIVGSKTVSIAYLGSGSWSSAKTPAVQALTPLTGGAEGTNPIDLVATTLTLEPINELLAINLPGVYDSATINPIITWCQNLTTRFLVVDLPSAGAGTADEAAAEYVNLLPGSVVGTPYTSSSYLGTYGPHLLCLDPLSHSQGATRLLPPGGSVLGKYALADGTVGPQQSAAGILFPLAGVVSTEVVFSGDNLDILNSIGANIIRPVVGNGICIMGARTLRYGYPDRYIAIRRTLMFMEKMLKDVLAFAVFQPNNARLWRKVVSVVSAAIDPLVTIGVLNGETSKQAYFVKCDADNNPPASVAVGILNVSVGLSLNTPAEFVIISVSQFNGVTTTSSAIQ